MNNNNKICTYSKSSCKDYVHTSITSEVSIDMEPPIKSPTVKKVNTVSVSHVPQTGNFISYYNNFSLFFFFFVLFCSMFLKCFLILMFWIIYLANNLAPNYHKIINYV